MNRPVINIADIELQSRPAAFAANGPAAERYDARMETVGAVIGARKLAARTRCCEASGAGRAAQRLLPQAAATQ